MAVDAFLNGIRLPKPMDLYSRYSVCCTVSDILLENTVVSFESTALVSFVLHRPWKIFMCSIMMYLAHTKANQTSS